MTSYENKIIHLASVRRERRPPSLHPMIETLRHHAATMQASALALRHSVAELEHDHEPRDEAFWQGQQHVLAAVQEQVQQCIDLLCGDLRAMPLALRIARYNILCSLFLARTDGEQATIQITAYLPHCQSQSEKSLRLRRGIVGGMRSLVSTVEQAIRLIETIEQEASEADCP